MGVGRKHGHVVSEGLETLDVFEGPFSGLLVEEYGQYLQVVIAEGVHCDIELVLAEGDAGLVEHHEQFFEAIEIGEQLGAAMDDAQLMVALLFHLKGQHLCAQSEVALRLQQSLLFTTVIFFSKVFVPVVKTDLPSSGTIRRLSLFEGTASEAGIDGHLAVLATVLGNNLWAFNSVHVLILQEYHLIAQYQYVIKKNYLNLRKDTSRVFKIRSAKMKRNTESQRIIVVGLIVIEKNVIEMISSIGLYS